MESSVSLVITAIVLVLLVIILPVYNVFTRQDDMSYNVILKATANLADTVRTTGYLDLDMYQQFMNEIQATHNTFEVELEGYKKRAVLIDGAYNDVEIIDYTDDILKIIESDKKQYKLEKGERFYSFTL